MLNAIWAGMIIVATVAGLLNGRGAELSAAVFSGCSNALQLALTMLGVTAFWSGLMRVAEGGGLLQAFARLLSPVIRRLFRSVRRGSVAEQAIAANLTAEIFGLSGSTPLGLNAMRELATQAPPGRASDDMMMLVLINTASVQVVPATIVAIRQSAGSVAPFAIMPVVWLTSLATVTVGIGMLKLLGRKG